MQFSSDIEQMVWMFGRGYSLSKIAEKFGIHRELIRRQMIKLGIDTNYHNRKIAEAKPYTALISEMREDGKSWLVISDKLGFSESTVKRYLKL